MLLSKVFKANQTISNGAKYNLKKGDTVRYDNLPNQPVAAIMYNNTGDNPSVRVGYGSGVTITLDAVQENGFGNGYCYVFDPNETNESEITFTLSNSGTAEANVDIYLVSGAFPIEPDTGIDIKELSLYGETLNFDGYSKAQCTPQFADYTLTIEAYEVGFMTVLFYDNVIKVLGVNIDPNTVNLNDYVISENGGMGDRLIVNSPEAGNRLTYDFFGTASLYAFAPISAGKGTLMLQQI